MVQLSIDIDEAALEAARKQARARQTTVEAEIAQWLLEYSQQEAKVARAMATIRELQSSIDTSGQKPSREELNARGFPRH